MINDLFFLKKGVFVPPLVKQHTILIFITKKISIDTIAEKVGLLTATISKMINNKVYVSQETSKRVL